MTDQPMSLAAALSALAPAARFAKAFQDVHAAIEAGASLEQAVREAEVALDQRRATLAELDAAIEQAIGRVEKAEADAAAIKHAAAREADTIRANARAQAKAEAAAAADAVAAADAAVAAAQERHNVIEGEVVAKAAELADLEARLDQAKAQARKLLTD